MGLSTPTHPPLHVCCTFVRGGAYQNIWPSLGVDKICESRHMDSYLDLFRRLNVLTLLFTVCISTVCCHPDGAPAEACSTLSPSQAGHGEPARQTSVPYEINMDVFRDTETGKLLYTPSSPYNSKLKSPTGSSNL